MLDDLAATLLAVYIISRNLQWVSYKQLNKLQESKNQRVEPLKLKQLARVTTWI